MNRIEIKAFTDEIMIMRASYMPEGLYDNKPVIRDTRLNSYVNGVIGSINNLIGGMYGIVPYYRDAEISVKRQPKFYRFFVDKGRLIAKKVGEVFGSYNPSSDKIEIDPDVVEGKAPVSLRRVLGEELIHYAQKTLGVLKRYNEKFGERARDFVEGSAATWADREFGETGVYPREKKLYEDYERNVGPKAAFLGA